MVGSLFRFGRVFGAPGGRRLGVCLLARAHGAVVFIAEVNGRALHGVRCLDERGVFREEGVVWQEHARLHVGMSFLQQEIAQQDARKQHAGADEVWQ